jgi:hypothetical protein
MHRLYLQDDSTKFDPKNRGSTVSWRTGVEEFISTSGCKDRHIHVPTYVITVYITYLGRAVTNQKDYSREVKQQKTFRKFLLIFGPKHIVKCPGFA